jgi:tyrocidine synthetase-3
MINELRKENVRDLRPLWPMQEGMLYHALREPDSPAYIEQTVFRIRGPLDVARLEQAWNALVARHDALRTVFVPAKATQSLQMVLRERRLAIALPEPSAFEDYCAQDRARTFDLTRDLLLRVAVFRQGPDDFHTIATHHHIILDGWSVGILMEELLAIYEARTDVGLPAPAASERYAAWLSAQNADRAREWWSSLAAGYEDPASLPGDPQAGAKGDLRVLNVDIDADTTARLSGFAAHAGITMNTITQCAWGILLARATNRRDVIFGMTVSGRPSTLPASERMTGLFINTVPVRVKFEDSETVGALAARMQEQISGGEPFHFLPLSEIQDVTAPRARLLDHLLTFENYPVGDALRASAGVRVAGLEISQESSHERTNYPLAIAIAPGERLRFSFCYLDNRYSAALMERVAEALQTVLVSFVPEKAVRDITLVGARAAEELALFEKGPVREFPSEETIAQVFERQARAFGNRVAVVDRECELTYAELNARANALAATLRLQPEEPVVLSLESSARMIIGILAVLKSGGAYVPVDPVGPAARRDSILTQTGSRVIIGMDHFPQAGNAPFTPPGGKPTDLAYILFTSGSTGEPKGVAIEQRSVLNLVFAGVKPLWEPIAGERARPLRVSLIFPPVFDGSVEQIFGALLCGHTLVIPSAEVKQDAQRLLDWLVEERIDICDGTPSQFSLLMEAGLTERGDIPVRHWMLGGEGLSSAMVREYFSGSVARATIARATISNLYGPTECCVANTSALISASNQDSLPVASIGRPWANQQVFVLDANSNRVPVFFESEICVGGSGVGRGYWGGERFGPIYRTGDIGRWLPDGRLEWIGRADDKVKVRGFRVELGEIEQALRAHAGIELAAAALFEGELAAWYTARAGRDVDLSGLREFLRSRLPHYMVPAFLTRVDAMPLNASGKLDRKRLPAPVSVATVQIERDANATEQSIRAIWEQVLGRTGIALNRDFFEAGGHSLKAMQVVTRIRRDLGVNLGVNEFFAAPTIEGLTALLAGRDAERFLHIERVPQAEAYAASHAQRRLWFLNQMESAAAYNMPAAVFVDFDADVERLRAALRETVRKHEILRTRLTMLGGELLQVVDAVCDPDFDVVDLRDERTAREYVEAQARIPFNLAEEAPLRVRLIRADGLKPLLFVNLHHAASDGISTGILARDVIRAYEQGALDPLRIQYRDYAAWANRAMEAAAGELHRRYWTDKFSGEIPALELPADRPRPAQLSFRGGKVRLALDPSLATALRELAARAKTTLFVALLAGLKALLYRYTSEQDIIVGTPVSGRVHADLESQIGCYMNTLPIRDRVETGVSFSDLVKSVRRTLTEALEHEIYPFDKLVTDLALARDTSRNPLFDVMAILQPGAPADALDPFAFERGVSKLDLTFDFAEQGNGSIDALIEYSADLFDHARIERMARHLACLLGSAAAAPETSVGKLMLLSPEERALVTAVSHDAAPQAPRCSEAYARGTELARVLVAAGVRPGDVVGLYLRRSPWLMLSEFAVLRAGGVFLPFALSIPSERAKFIAADSGMKFLISDANELPEWAAGISVVDPRGASVASAVDLPEIDPEAAAYLLYTSGSTGAPKGVAVPHRAMLSFASTLRSVFGFRAGETIYASTPATFDISILELVCAPIMDVEVAIASDEAMEDPALMASEIERSGATLLQFTPSRLEQLLAEASASFLRGARVLLVGGEAFPDALVDRLRALPRLEVWNVYGPTETCIWSTAEQLSGGPLTIGSALQGECVFILSPDLEPQPIGVPGEIAIGGVGLAIGYRNNPELTAQRFVHAPFAPGGRLYLTGDQGRLNDDGRIEYIGRKDFQVKLRGYRIELGEIEHHLRTHASVESTALAMREVDGRPELVAYVVAREPIEERDLRAHLQRSLPDYMAPAIWVFLDKLPLNASGKVDRRALPAPVAKGSSARQWEAPRTALEWRIAGIFEEVLGRHPVGRHANFFDLGGQSLKAMQALSRLRRDVAQGLKLADLFTAPTVAGLAELAAAQTAAGHSAIPLTPESKAGYPLTHAQRRLWVLEQMNPDAVAYNMPAAFRLEGSIDVARLERAVNALVERHEILRTIFQLEAGEPRQFVRAMHEAGAIFGAVDLRALSEPEARLEALLAADAREPFDLARGPLFRATIFRIDDSQAVLAFRMHHIVSDAWSMRVLLKDLLALYRSEELERPAIQYRDYAAWQDDLVRRGALDAQRDYWHKRLATPLPVLDLPTDLPRPSVQSFRGGEHRFVLSVELASALRAVAREAGASMFMTLMAAVKTLLYRYTGAEDIIVGTPVAGREHPQVEALAGVFVNSLALRDALDASLRFRDLLRAVRATVTEALEHQTYPFDSLVDELILDRDTSRSAFFDVMVSAGREDEVEGFEKGGGLAAHAIVRPTGVSKFDLSLDFTELADGRIETAIEYNRDLFLRTRIERIETHLATLLRSIAANPDETLANLVLLPHAERELVLREFNTAAAEFDPEATVVDLVELHARKHPKALATWCEGRAWTYREWNSRGDRLARKMIEERGIGPGSFVAVYTKRSDWMLASFLAVLKAGAAYVPIDPAYTAERVALLLQSSGCGLVLCEPRTAGFASRVETWNVAEVETGEGPSTPRRHTPRDLAYVIFTSGSTGAPKGVMIEHLSLANMVSHFVRNLKIGRGDRSTILASMAFDASVAEYWPILCAGGSMHFPADEVRESPGALAQWIASAGLTIINSPTSLGEMLLRNALPEGLRVRVMLVGGEKLRPLLSRTYPFELINTYGPTETTVDATWARLTPAEYAAPNPPIGRPVQNALAYVLDAQLNPAPMGVPGELFIGGLLLARGYINRPDLTNQKFITNPFVNDGSRMYATGDRVRWREDGQLEYLGRTDLQVKVRGYRIEPGEIEARLLEHPAIAAAAVGAVRVGESDELAAWVVAREGAAMPDAAELRDFVRAALPEFMTPSSVMTLERMPMTPNGKIHRAALPAPAVGMGSAKEIVAPRTTIESAIHGAWRAILGRSDFGVTCNFFDLGGHSLKAMQLSARLLNALNVEIPLRDIFLANTVAAQAELAATKQRAPARRIEPAPQLPDYPLSRAQRRLWLTAQMEGSSGRYNMPGAYVIEGEVDEAALRRAVAAILERHEALRTRFVVRDGEPRQVIDPPEAPDAPSIDLREASAPEDAARELAEADVRQPFDLARDRLFRCRLLRLADRRYVLLFTLHHIAGDGWSMQVLYEELRELYSAFAEGREPALAAPRLQYKDYAWWERETGFAVDEAWWLARMRSLPDPIRLPFDLPEKDVYEFTGAAEGLLLPQAVSDELRRIAGARGTTLSNVLLTVFFVFLNRLTEQQDLALAMSVANRPHRDLETMAGFFVNAVVLRGFVDEDKPFEKLLDEVTAEVAGALEHQQYPLDLLIERLNPPRRGNRQPLFNVVYAFQGFTDVVIRPNAGEGAGIEISGEINASSRTSKFDVTLFVVDNAGPRQDAIYLSMEYSTELLRAETVRHWLEILGRFCEAATAREESAAHALGQPRHARRERGWRLISLKHNI